MASSTKKIAFLITSTGWGGLEMNVLKLAKSLTENGFSITLFTQQNSTINQKGAALFQQVNYISKNRKYFDFITAKAISKKLNHAQIHQVIVFDNKDLDVIAWTKRMYKKDLKIIYQQHMQIGINKKDILHTIRFGMIDSWISPLNYLKEEVRKCTRFPVERVQIIPIGIATERFTTRKYTKDEARSILHLAPKAPLFGIIGRISEKKGQLVVVKALQQLIKQGRHAELLIVGSATVNDPECQQYEQELHQYVTGNQLEKYIHFVPHNEDVQLFYNATDYFILASHSETYGMVTIESMLSGVPVIATKSGGTTEILEQGKLGLLYTYNAESELAEKMKQALDNPEMMLMMAEKAKQTALNNYADSQEINGFLKLLTE